MASPSNNADISAEYAQLLPELSRTASECATLMARWPSGEEHEYHKAFRGFTAFTRAQLKQHAELMQLISVCYRDQQPGGGGGSATTTTEPIEAIDALLENVDHLLDSVRGVRVDATRQEEIRIGLSSAAARGGGGGGGAGSPTTATSLTRPQDSFKIKPDNFAEHFHHFVATADTADKNNKKAKQQQQQQPHQHRIYVSLDSAGDATAYSQLNISSFHWKPEHQSPPTKETVFLPLETTKFNYIDTPEALSALATTILQSGDSEIAVDVEHHSEYSYLGFTCLIQISTRSADYIIDTIALRDEMWRLAPVFHDPSIVKVLHSATEDVRWLQRDFGLFIVNLFDTAIALQTLRMPHSLAFLVDHLCQVKLNKKHQNDDWRLRPLSESMLKYAQQDTHYLLYCYDRLRSMLASAETRASVGNLLMYVLQESKRLAATMYKKPPFSDETTWKETLGRSIAGLYQHQLKAIQGLFNWREVRARTVDTSPHAILSNGQLLSIGCRLPSTAAEVLRMANPATVEVRRSVKELLAILEEARKMMGSTTSSSSAAAAAAATAGPQQQQEGRGAGTATAGEDAAAAAGSSKTTTTMMAPRRDEASAAAVHCPMTGTLPSVMDREQQQEHQRKKDQVSADAAVGTSTTNSGADGAQLPVWMNCFHALPAFDLATCVPVPAPGSGSSSLPKRRGRSQSPTTADEQQQQEQEEEVQETDGGSDSTARVDADDEHEQGSLDKDAAGENKNKQGSDAQTMPQSLAEAHGGLGRSHRKKKGGAARG